MFIWDSQGRLKGVPTGFRVVNGDLGSVEGVAESPLVPWSFRGGLRGFLRALGGLRGAPTSHRGFHWQSRGLRGVFHGAVAGGRCEGGALLGF